MFNLAAKHNETIKFTFDTRLESEHNAGLLYGQLLDSMPEWKARFFPEVPLPAPENTPGFKSQTLWRERR